jgi:hypothetical protein
MEGYQQQYAAGLARGSIVCGKRNLRRHRRGKECLDSHRRLNTRESTGYENGGDTWIPYATPLMTLPTAGAFTLAFRDHWHGIVGGGDLHPSDPNKAAPAKSNDGGKTWTRTNKPPVGPAPFLA